MDRRDFIRMTGGVLTSLGMQQDLRALSRSDVDTTYLARGLTAMARPDNWFDAHWGASVIAGAYLCSDFDLEPELTISIREQIDMAIAENPDQFRSFADAGVQKDATTSILQSLKPAMSGGLREHGHAVIYAALALRALNDVPRMATPSIVEGLRGQLTRIAQTRPQTDRGKPSYSDTQAFVQATFESLRRFEALLGRPEIHRPNFTHMMTHTEALARLEALGHGEFVRAGHGGHAVHIGSPVPSTGKAPPLSRPEVTFEGLLDPDFWKNEERQALWHRPYHRRSNPNGDWIASGHLFKVLYAFCTLARRMDDREMVQRSGAVLFERYFHPDVQGG